MTGYAEWRVQATGGGRKTVTLTQHGRGTRFRIGETAMNLTWRFSDGYLASGSAAVAGRGSSADARLGAHAERADGSFSGRPRRRTRPVT